MNSQLPKYLKISLQIIASIKDGELAPGMQIPSENDIRRSYGVSNTTARKVLQEIELRGLVVRIKGRGTYVRNADNDHAVERTLGSIATTRNGFDTNMLKEGFTPSIKYLEQEIIEEDMDFSLNGQLYNIPGPIFKIRRLRLSDDIVMKDDTRYIPLKVCKNFDKINFEKYMSFFQIYEEFYIYKVADIKHLLTTSIMDDDDMNTFVVEEKRSLFNLKGITFIGKGLISEIEISKYHGDKYRFLVNVNN